ncbi:MAG: nucleotide exchange factor GrpE [Planctomycetota bacterium]
MSEPTLEEEVVPEASPATDAASADDDGLTVPASVLHAVQAERDEYLALAQKTRADLENYRRRVARDRDAERLQTQADLLQEILNPIDDLDRALAAAGRERNFDSLFEGLEMVRRSLWKSLGHAGFERIPAEHGDVFDPNVHEAMMKVPHPEVPENHIVEELSPGYRLGERVLRAARVMVSGGPPPEGEGDETA